MPELDVDRSDYNKRKSMFKKKTLKTGRGNAWIEDEIHSYSKSEDNYYIHSSSESEDDDDLPIGSIRKSKRVRRVEIPAVKTLVSSEEAEKPTEKVGKKRKEAKKLMEEPIGSTKKSKKGKVQERRQVKKMPVTAQVEKPTEQVAKEPNDAKKPIKKTKVVTFDEKEDKLTQKPTTKVASKHKGEKDPVEKSLKKSSATVARSTRNSTHSLKDTAKDTTPSKLHSEGMFQSFSNALVLEVVFMALRVLNFLHWLEFIRP
jgi:hypothetical protein